MTFCFWSTRSVKVENMPSSCKIGDGYVPGSIREVSRNGLEIEIRTSQLQDGLNDWLHQPITLSVENTILEGTLEWYTIEGFTYRVGIAISPKQRAAWIKIFSDRLRGLMHPATKTA
jgi:hypothetical protein